MAIIGTLKLGADGVFSGDITTLTISRKVRIVPTDIETGNAPDFRVFSGLAEIGVAWTKQSQKSTTYYAIKFDDPTLPAPFWANMVESQKEGQVAVYNLLWDRPKPQP